MEKKIYSQPMIKVLSMANVCDVGIEMSVEPAVYGPAPDPIVVEPVEDYFN